MGLEVDISGLDPATKRELVAGRLFRQVADREDAFHRQCVSAREIGEHRSVDGLGQMILQLDPTVFQYWGEKFGTYECWNDKTFLREMRRDCPEVRVKCTGTRPQSGFSASATPINAPISRGPRWSKTYQL